MGLELVIFFTRNPNQKEIGGGGGGGGGEGGLEQMNFCY